ncbi:MAG: DegT/DnrJ/EryC1/StrS family aminotransferase [Candidatus Sumerlaeaceae bacterium]
MAPIDKVITIPFGDLSRQYRAHREDYDAAVQRVMERGWFVLGEEGRTFEDEFAAYTGAVYCVGCNSGTDAIRLALAAHEIGPGDSVMTVANTCVPTVVGIIGSGAAVRLCDANLNTALMDASSLDHELRKHPCKAVVPVHLYGQPADLEELQAVANRHGALLIEDAAQAHGAMFKGQRIGSHGNTVAWSFYPSKNLGAFGDGGAVTTNDAAVAERLTKLRNYGQSKRYHHDSLGINSRLDEVQAAVLRGRLPRLESENSRRRQIARQYRDSIGNRKVTFFEQSSHTLSCEHLFPIRVADRDSIIARLESLGIQTLIHYPIPIHRQKAYSELGYSPGNFPHAEQLCNEVLSIPMFPELTDDEVNAVIASLNEALDQ